MNLAIDLINLSLVLLVKPMLVMMLVMYFVNTPNFRSAASSHWMILLAIFSPLLVFVFFGLFPAIDIRVLPSELAAYTQKTVFSFSRSPLSTPNLLTTVTLVVYVSGVLFVLMKMSQALAQTFKLGRTARLATRASLKSMQIEMARKFGVSKPVEVLVSEGIKAPVMWGFFSPKILLPQQYLSWCDDRLARVLAHEYAHISRNDWFSKMFGGVMCAIFWVNPLMWLAARQSSWYAELACDDLVVNKLDCRAEYADDLLELSTDVSHHFALAFIRESELFRRIQAVLDGAKNRDVPDKFFKLLNLMILLFLVIPLSMLQAKQTLSPPDDGEYTLMPLKVVENLTFSAIDVPPEPTREPEKHFLLADLTSVLSPEELRSKYNINILGRESRLLGISLGQFEENVIEESPAEKLLEDSVQIARSRVDNYSEGVSSEGMSLEGAASTALPLTIDDRESVNQVSIEPFQLVKKNIPHYPSRALRKNIEGTVVVKMDVGVDGQVLNPTIVSSKPGKIFDRAVLKSLRKYIYKPKKMNGKAIITKNVTKTFVFLIEDTTDT